MNDGLLHLKYLMINILNTIPDEIVKFKNDELCFL